MSEICKSFLTEEPRRFWIEHGKACSLISNYLAEQLGEKCGTNIWTGGGFKDIPAGRVDLRMQQADGRRMVPADHEL